MVDDPAVDRAANLPALSYSQRMARAEDKQRLVREFLSSGEQWTTTANAAVLLNLSRQQTEKCLHRLVDLGELTSSEMFLNLGGWRRERVWGATRALLDAHGQPDLAAFSSSRVNAAYAPHHLHTQHLHILSRGAGLRWIPGKILSAQSWRDCKNKAAGRLRKVPDAMLLVPYPSKIGEYHRVAVEVELHQKTAVRYKDSISRHLDDMGILTEGSTERGRELRELAKQNAVPRGRHYDQVHYICPSGNQKTFQATFDKIGFVKNSFGLLTLEDFHRYRIKFFSADEWIAKLKDWKTKSTETMQRWKIAEDL